MEFGVLFLLIPSPPPLASPPPLPLCLWGPFYPLLLRPPPSAPPPPPLHLKIKGSSLSVFVLSEVSSVSSRTQVAICYNCQYCFTTKKKEKKEKKKKKGKKIQTVFIILCLNVLRLSPLEWLLVLCEFKTKREKKMF